MNLELENEVLLDTKPVPVLSYKRNKMRSDFMAVQIMVCVPAVICTIYKLVVIASKDGIPLVYDLVPANTDERRAAETVLSQLSGFTVLADKGFIGKDWQNPANFHFPAILS